MTVLIHDLAALRARLAGWRAAGEGIAFVPTMGNLHAGHVSLLALARQHMRRVVVSSFVNPTQFAAGEDFGRYPRTPDADLTLLREAGCDLLWAPALDTMYPFGVDAAVQMHVPGVSDVLEGAHRPGHFDGVATVVARLLTQVQPQVVIFGRKDYQQLVVVRRMVADLAMSVEIVAGAIVRDADGLALSSRNQYLSLQERAQAPQIQQALLGMRDAAQAGQVRGMIEQAARAQLEAAGFVVDYMALRRPDLTEPADGEHGPRVALAAARLGRTRLIDNLEFDV
jgi:pantoate--beta-alanine ligase